MIQRIHHRAGRTQRLRYVFLTPDEEAALRALADRGVMVNLGAHGQLQGLGAHWELWMLQQGGMTNHEALQAATIVDGNQFHRNLIAFFRGQLKTKFTRSAIFIIAITKVTAGRR